MPGAPGEAGRSASQHAVQPGLLDVDAGAQDHRCDGGEQDRAKDELGLHRLRHHKNGDAERASGKGTDSHPNVERQMQ
jgi:hypothetical protein